MPQPNTLITGASSGIGKALALLLAQLGHNLILTGRDAKRLRRVASACEKAGAKVDAEICELADLDQVEALGERIVKRRKRLDGLVNNAASFDAATFMDLSSQQLEAHMRVNVTAPLVLTQRLVPLLAQSKNASIVNVSSTLGSRPIPGQSAYCASKAALHSLTQSMALELGPLGIRANAILPGIVDTPIHDKSFDAATKKAIFEEIGKSLPAGKIGQPKDVVGAIAHLLSKESQWTTGALWVVDGGINILSR